MKKLLFFSLFIMGAFVLTTSCSNSKKTETAASEESPTESAPVVEIIDFADNDLSEALDEIMWLDTDDCSLQIDGNDVTLTVKIKGNSSAKDLVDATIAERLGKAKITMCLYDDDYTEIGNQRLELSDITFTELLEWVVANDLEKKEITFACKDFTAVSKLKSAKRAKIFATE